MSNIIPIRQTDPADFDSFWAACPKKTGPGYARSAWHFALCLASAQEIIAGAERYADWCRRNQLSWQFIMTPEKWLKGQHWADELPNDRTAALSVERAPPDRLATIARQWFSEPATRFKRDWIKSNLSAHDLREMKQRNLITEEQAKQFES